MAMCHPPRLDDRLEPVQQNDKNHSRADKRSQNPRNVGADIGPASLALKSRFGDLQISVSFPTIAACQPLTALFALSSPCS
jgi:hypothetical protein